MNQSRFLTDLKARITAKRLIGWLGVASILDKVEVSVVTGQRRDTRFSAMAKLGPGCRRHRQERCGRALEIQNLSFSIVFRRGDTDPSGFVREHFVLAQLKC